MKFTIWERFAFWDHEVDHDYYWWPVVGSNYQRWASLLSFELRFLKFRVGITLYIKNG